MKLSWKGRNKHFEKKKANNWNTNQIDACAIHQTKACYMQSEQLVVEKVYLGYNQFFDVTLIF
jgi:hypothetical protein